MSDRSAAVGRGVVVQVVARVVALFVSLATVATSTRYLGPAEYGMLVGAVVAVGLFESLTELGIGQVIVRRVGQGKGALSRLAGVHLGFSLVLGPFAALLAVLSGFALAADSSQERTAIAIIAVGLIFTALSKCGTSVFQTKVRFGASAVADFSSRLLALLGTLVVAQQDLGLLAMAAVQVIHPLTRMVVMLYAAGRMEPWRIRFSGRETWSLVRESLPLTAMIVVGVLYWRASGVLVAALSVNEQVAAYGVALAIAGNLTVLPQVVASTALSTLAERWAENRGAFNRTVRTIYRTTLVIILPVWVFGWVYATDLVELINGPEFGALAGPVLQLFLIGVGLSFLNPVLSNALFCAGRQRFLIKSALVTLTVNVAINIALIPSLGAVGAGIALIASELVGVTMSTYVLYRVGVRLPSALDVARILPAISLGLAMVYILRDAPVVVSGLVVSALFGATVLATGALPSNVVRSLLGRRFSGRSRHQKLSA